MPRPPQRKMKPGIRELVEWAGSHGWELQKEKDGNGHWVLKHPEAGTVRLADTPGEARGVANAKAEIRRRSGLPNDSGPAAKYRHEGRRDGFDMEAALKEQRLRRAHEEAESLRQARVLVQLAETRRALEGVNPRRDPVVAHELATRVMTLKRQLNTA